jgi:hypothetical protein
MMRQKGATMQFIPKVYRAGLILALVVLALVFGMLPTRVHVSAIPIQPSSEQVSEYATSASLRGVAALQHQ